MTREDAKDLTLSILVIVVVLLIADCIWLHIKCAGLHRSECALQTTLEAHLNPPPVPTVADKTKGAYDRAKDSTVREYKRLKAATAAGYDAAKKELDK